MHVKIRLLKPHEHLLLHSYVLRLLCCTSYLTKARVTSHVAKMSPRLRDTCNSTDDSAKLEKVWPWEKGSFGNELAPKKKKTEPAHPSKDVRCQMLVRLHRTSNVENVSSFLPPSLNKDAPPQSCCEQVVWWTTVALIETSHDPQARKFHLRHCRRDLRVWNCSTPIILNRVPHM